MQIVSEQPSQILLSNTLPHILRTCPSCGCRTVATSSAFILFPSNARPWSTQDTLIDYIAQRYIKRAGMAYYFGNRQTKTEACEMTAYSEAFRYPCLHSDRARWTVFSEGGNLAKDTSLQSLQVNQSSYTTLKVISTLKSIGVGSPSRMVGWYFLLATALRAAGISNG